MPLTDPPSIDKRLLALTQKNSEQSRQQTLKQTRQQARLMRSKSLLVLTAGILLLTVLIAVGH